MKGKLIVLEGTDGSGKATQAKLLYQHLERDGVPVRKIDFPRYGNPFAEPAKRYLAGELGGRPEDVSAYAASTFYAVDRYASYRQDWGAFYEAGGLVIADRYTTSNAVHQASKLSGRERQEFLSWLFDLEYHRLELPEPDLVFFLEVPISVTEQLMRRRETASGVQADIHERDEAYQRQCRTNASELARAWGWEVVHCAQGETLRTVEDIHEQVYRKVREL